MDVSSDCKENQDVSLNTSDASLLRQELRDFNMSIGGKSMSWAIDASDNVGSDSVKTVPTSPKPVLSQRQYTASPVRSPEAIREKLDQAEKRRQAQLEARKGSAASEAEAVRQAAEARSELEQQYKKKTEEEIKKKMQEAEEHIERVKQARNEATSKQKEREDKVRQAYKESLAAAYAKWADQPLNPLNDSALDAIPEEDLDKCFTEAEEQLKAVRHMLDSDELTPEENKTELQEKCTIATKNAEMLRERLEYVQQRGERQETSSNTAVATSDAGGQFLGLRRLCAIL